MILVIVLDSDLFTSVYWLLSHSPSFVVFMFCPLAPKKIHSESAKHYSVMPEDNLALIECQEKGEKVVAIVWSFGMSQTTVSTTVYNKDKILTLKPQG